MTRRVLFILPVIATFLLPVLLHAHSPEVPRGVTDRQSDGAMNRTSRDPLPTFSRGNDHPRSQRRGNASPRQRN